MRNHLSNQFKISAFIVAHNEERVIARCLESLVDVVDEIIVIHDGPCADNTLKIARKFSNNVFEMPINKGIGESHYIFAIKKAANNWILRIDADEYLSDKLQTNIRKLVQNDDISAYNFIWPIWDGTKYISKGWPYKIFLFQKDKVGIIDLFHHPIIVHGISKNVPLLMHHKPLYNNYTYNNFKEKTLKWCKYQAKDYLEPIENKASYNVDIQTIAKEVRKKRFLYNFPMICLIISYLTVVTNLLKEPRLVSQKGFWLTALISGRYSYFVAKEYLLLKKELK